MGYCDPPLSYEELLHEFKVSLTRVLSGARLPPVTAMADVALTLALLDIAYAVRRNRPTPYLVSRACAAFADFAADQDATSQSDGAWHQTPTPAGPAGQRKAQPI